MFTGRVRTQCSTLYFQAAADDTPGMDECFEDQTNGLCGARIRNFLFLVTGLHTGHVNMTVDFCDQEPPLEDAWEEVVVRFPNVLCFASLHTAPESIGC